LRSIFDRSKKMEMKMRISKKSSITVFVLLVLSIRCVSHTTSAAETWIGTWATGQQLVESQNNPASPGLANNTLRQIVHATLGGSRIRVQFSNKYSTGATTINSAHIAISNSGIPINSSIDTATDTALTFGGSPSVTIAAGDEIYSDAVDFNVAPMSNLTVSIYFGSDASSTSVTGHPGSRTSYYLKTGNTVSDAEMQSGYRNAEHWYVLSRIDVWLDDSHGCAVTLGDSITDGRGCDPNYNNRWPDDFASRVHANPDTVKVGVINEGIGGNCVVSGGLGPTALSRFDHDVLEQPGVKWVIILEGVNDLGSASSSSIVTSITNAYQEFIDKAHTHGILVYGVLILPFKGSGYANGNSNRLTWRNQINDWIRTSGQFDAVIDLDPAVWDPADHEKLNPAYLFENDYLHLNVAGQQAMADAIDLSLFEEPKGTDVVAGNMMLINDNGGWCWYQDEKIVYDPVGGNILTSMAAVTAR
jgi:lysophospholipase L1-like esterase